MELSFDEKIATYSDATLLEAHTTTCKNVSYYNAAEGNQYDQATRDALAKSKYELTCLRKELDQRGLEYSEAGYLL